MGIRLTDLMQHGAAAGAQLYSEGYKADIMAERDAALARMRGEERAADRDFRTEERLAGQAFSSEEAALDRGVESESIDARSKSEADKTQASREEKQKDREGRVEVAKIRSGGAGGTQYKVVGKRLVDLNTGKELELPESKSDLRSLAASLAKVDVEGAENQDLESPLSAKQLTDRYVKDWTAAKKESPKDDDTSVVVFTHSKHGDITEDDITSTMEKHGLTRQQVLDRLGK